MKDCVLTKAIDNSPITLLWYKLVSVLLLSAHSEVALYSIDQLPLMFWLVPIKSWHTIGLWDIILCNWQQNSHPKVCIFPQSIFTLNSIERALAVSRSSDSQLGIGNEELDFVFCDLTIWVERFIPYHYITKRLQINWIRRNCNKMDIIIIWWHKTHHLRHNGIT